MPIPLAAEQRANDLCADIAACWRARGIRPKMAMLVSLESSQLEDLNRCPEVTDKGTRAWQND